MDHDPTTVHRIFALACELHGAARAACLQEQCGDDDALRAEVERLLRHDDSDEYLDEPRLLRMRAQVLGDDGGVPERVGAFRVLGELGRGGMGVVYRAAQDAPARDVALKVLAPGLAGDDARARFAIEAEALGRLQHPGIAQIYEAGTYESAGGPRPYLAMEFVDGAPLPQWANAAPRSLAQRLDVLVQLCAAVQHAHQKGVIHRDLKPSNVLVDGDGRVKVLDFGIARFVSESRDHTLMTRTGQLMGTLAYMSPEQADGVLDRVDARADVYAIGVVAYELLSGRLPVDVRDAPLTTALRRIVDEQPAPLGQQDRALRGDLETVVQKALRKEPDRRYATAQAFADDLRRVLAHEPVQARPATAAYVVRRFARRHRGLVAGVLVATLALVGGASASIVWALRADAAQANAETEARAAKAAQRDAEIEGRVANRIFTFVRTMFEAAAPKVALGAEVSAADIVREGARTIRDELRDEPVLFGRLGRFLGATLSEMGDYDAGEALLGESIVALREAGVGGALLADALRSRAIGALTMGRLDEAEAQIAEALALLADAGDEDEVRHVRTRAEWTRGVAHLHRREFDQALDAFARAQRANAGSDDPIMDAQILEQIANTHQVRGDLPGAAAAFERALAVMPEDANPLVRGILATNLGNLRVAQRDLPAAEALFRDALRLGELHLGERHPVLIRRLCNLAGVVAQQRRLDDAAVLLERAVRLGDDVDSRYDDGVANACTNLGNVRAMRGDLDAAFALWQRAAEILERRLGPDSRELADVLENMAVVHQQAGRIEQAEALRERVADIRAKRR